MRRQAAVVFLCLIANTLAYAETLSAPQTRFAAVDVYLDSGDKALAAWQFELADHDARIQVVGIESGEHPAFDEPPHYDRDAVAAGKADRVAVADFSLATAGELPKGQTRIATVHVRIEGDTPPDYHIALIAAGDTQGQPIPAKISISKR